VIKHLSSGPRAAAAAFAVVGLLALTALPAAAATPPTGDKSYSQNGSTAEFNASNCTENGDNTITCTDLQLGAFVGKMTDSFSGVTHLNQLCASVGTYTVDTVTWEYVGEPVYERGCKTDLPNGSIKIDARLASATLSPTTLHLEQLTCDKESCTAGPSRDAVVAGSWTQAGPIGSSKSRSTYSDDLCRQSYANKSSGRMASFTGSLGGLAINTPDLGYLGSGRETFRSRCSEG
jgi:hypothetical protein